MNKRFKYYYKDGLRKSRKEFKKKKNLGKFYAYLLSSAIGRIILFLFMPAFTLSDYKLAKMVDDGENLELSKVYAAMDRPKNFWTCVLIGINTLLIFFGGILVILLPTAILAGIGYIIAYALSNPQLSMILPIAFGVPGALVLFVYLIVFPFYVAPVYYIVSIVDGVNASDALKNSFRAMKEGKWTTFAIIFVNSLVILIFLAIVAGIFYGTVMVLPPVLYNARVITNELFIMVRAGGVLVTVIFFLLLLRYLPVRIVATQVSLMNLFNDLLVRYKDSLDGIYIKGVKIEKTSFKNYKSNLIKLFDETTGYSKYEEPKQESVEVIKESTPEEIKEEYLENDNKVEKLADKAHEEEAAKEEAAMEETKPLSKKELKAQKKAEKQAEKEALKEQKKEKKSKKKEVPAQEEPVETEEAPVEKEATETTETQEAPVQDNNDEINLDEFINENTQSKPTEETETQEEEPDFHQSYDNDEEDGPLFTDEADETPVEETSEAEAEEVQTEEPVQEEEVQSEPADTAEEPMVEETTEAESPVEETETQEEVPAEEPQEAPQEEVQEETETQESTDESNEEETKEE